MDLLISANTVAQTQADTAPATGTPGWATDGDPAKGILATDSPAWHYNMMMAELIAVVKAAGITPSNSDWSQVLKAIQTLFAPAQRGVAPYNAALATLIGGYPKFAVVVDASGTFWVSMADQNTTVPGANGATWQSLFTGLVSGAAQGQNEPVLGLQMVNDAEGDTPTTYLQVATPTGALAVPTLTNVETRLSLLTPQGYSSHQALVPTPGEAFWIESDATFNVSGKIFMFASANMGADGIQQPSQAYLRIYLDDVFPTSEYTTGGMSLSWVSDVPAGAHTIKALYLPNTGDYTYFPTGMTLSWLFVPNPT